MKLLINASNIKKSGALQVTLSFLAEIKADKVNSYEIVLSEAVDRQIDKEEFGYNFKFHLLSLKTPFSTGYRNYKGKMNEIEKNANPDCVFSVFAPTYWTPKAPHLSGFAYVWAINSDSEYIKSLDFKDYFKQKIENIFKSIFFKRNSKYYVVETEDVKDRLSKYIGINPNNIYVVNNTCNHYFNEGGDVIDSNFKLPNRDKSEFRFITISSNFPHKNLRIIKEVAAELRLRGVNDVKFYITIPENDYNELFGFSNDVINLGTVKASDCPAIYNQCDALFLPTLLECFSASYPEAMKMRKPIITSDLGFARSICKEAALYVNPFDPKDIAEKVIELKSNWELYKDLVTKGTKRVNDFPTPNQRANQYIELCKKIVKFEKEVRWI